MFYSSSRGSKITPSHFMLQKPEIRASLMSIRACAIKNKADFTYEDFNVFHTLGIRLNNGVIAISTGFIVFHYGNHDLSTIRFSWSRVPHILLLKFLYSSIRCLVSL